MSLAFTNAAVANRDGRGHAFDRDWSGAATADVRAVTLCFVLLITALWMTTRPYLGIIGDARFYTVQALNALLPGRFASDLYFRYGSQDQFTLFTLAYEPVLAALGIAKAGMTLTIIGECGWIGGLIYLARGLFRNGRLALVAVVTAIVLPGGVVMLNYGEQFLTPRLVVEAITLWALGSMLRGKVIRALLLLSLAATVHPLVALPGFAVLFLYQAAERRVWWIMGGFAAMASLGLAVLGVQPFARLLTKFDTAWFEIVRVRDFHCLLTEWSLFDWLKACNIFAVGALGLSVAEPRERRFLVMAFVVSLGGLAVTLVGGDFLHNVLVVDAQQYRATWPLAVGANLFVGPLLLRLRWTVLSPVTRAGLAWTIGTLVATQFIVAGYFVTVPQLLIFGLAAAREQNSADVGPRWCASMRRCHTGFGVRRNSVGLRSVHAMGRRQSNAILGHDTRTWRYGFGAGFGGIACHGPNSKTCGDDAPADCTRDRFGRHCSARLGSAHALGKVRRNGGRCAGIARRLVARGAADLLGGRRSRAMVRFTATQLFFVCPRNRGAVLPRYRAQLSAPV